ALVGVFSVRIDESRIDGHGLATFRNGNARALPPFERAKYLLVTLHPATREHRREVSEAMGGNRLGRGHNDRLTEVGALADLLVVWDLPEDVALQRVLHCCSAHTIVRED